MDTADVAQVVTYAELKDVARAFLVYPERPLHEYAFQIGPIRIESVPFELGREIEKGGSDFLRALKIFDSVAE